MNKMEQIIELDVKNIKANPKQPRKDFDKGKLVELANSIKGVGLINPIQVKKVGKKYELVCGERRLRAHLLLKKKKIQAIVKKYNNPQEEMVESLVENLHRTDLASFERENFIHQMWKTEKYKSSMELGKAIGMSDTNILNNLRARRERKKFNIPSNLSTRIIVDIGLVKNVEHKKKLIEAVKKNKIKQMDVRGYAQTLRNSKDNVAEALLSQKITFQQAKSINKFEDEATRQKIIQTHHEIKNIDESIEKGISKTISQAKRQLVKTKEVILAFRKNALESQKANQQALGSLKSCIGFINLMDEEQLKQLKYFQDKFESNLSNVFDLSENIGEKIEEII